MSKFNRTRITVIFTACIGAAVVAAQLAGAPAPKKPEPAPPPTVQPAASPTVQPAAPPKINDPAQASAALVAAFNRGSARDVAALFLPDAELTDDAGNVHRGRKEIEAILTALFEKFPGAQLQQKIESTRLLHASLAIEDGEQTITTKDGKEKSDNEITAVLVRLETGWAYASLQQFPIDEEPSPHERLEALAWLVGDWVDEDREVNMVISCRWEGENFLMVNYESNIAGKAGIKSTQRIGWDPLTGRVRSWVFDSDGGYGEGQWTLVDKAWIIKSTAVMPDGDTGSATIVIEPAGPDKFTLKGLDRIMGEGTQPDFQATIVRKPPQPAP